MSHDIVVQNKERMQLLRTFTGEGNLNAIKMNMPQIKIDTIDIFDDKKKNPNYGGFNIVERIENDNGQYENKITRLGKSFEGVIFKERYMASHFNKNSDTIDYYSYEFDEWGDNVTILSKKKVMDTGSYRMMKEKYGLSPSLILYVLIEDKVYRFKSSSSALFTYGDYKSLFFTSSVCLVMTEFSTERRRQKPGSPWYFVPMFKQSGGVDEQVVFELVKKLDSEIKMSESLRSGGSKKEFREEVVPTLEERVEKEDRISVEDLPF